MDFLYVEDQAPCFTLANTLLLFFDVCESILVFCVLNILKRQTSCYAHRKNPRDAGNARFIGVI
jgi:hypothetical protein